MQASSRRSRARRAARSASPRRTSRKRERSRPRAARKQPRRKTRHTARANTTQNHAQARRLNAAYQAAVKTYEAGARAFQQQNYGKAKELFQKLVSCPVLDVAERARVHVRMCEQRLNPVTPSPKGIAEYYNLGVAELNARRLDSAVEHLTKALKTAPDRDEVRYALAAAFALLEKADAALEHLQAAVALRSENRLQARRDEDFEALRSDDRFNALLYP